MPPVSRGFSPRRRPSAEVAARLPPGQYLTPDFPVLAVGPTPRGAARDWRLRAWGAGEERSWSWEELLALPQETVTADIHCVTQWSKLGTTWTGVSLDVLLDGVPAPASTHAVAHCEGGYTTNLPLADPARLLVPHLYFWKSAKWIRGLELLTEDRPGYWEVNGYHDRGDPWQEQRYQGD